MQIDLNADLGESYGPYVMGNDEAMLDIVSSANVACGFHGGDPTVMQRTVAACVERNVAIGAHPGFKDLEGFGRRRITGLSDDELRGLLWYQIGALSGVSRAMDASVTHVKMHGALANMASESDQLASTCAAAIKSFDPALRMVTMASTALERAAHATGLSLAREIYADRAYNDDGTLVSRGTPGAVIHDADEAADRILAAVESGTVVSVSGRSIPVGIDTICVHGDNPSAVEMATRVRSTLEEAGHTIAAF